MIIRKIKNILFFLLVSLIVIYLFSLLGIIEFLSGLIQTIAPLFWAFFISVCLESIIKKFITKGYKRKKVVIVVYLSIVAILGLVSYIILPSFISQIQIFIDAIPSLLNDINNLFKKVNLNINILNLIDDWKLGIDKVMKYFSNSFTIIINLGISLSSAFFISYDYDLIKEKTINIIPNIIKKEILYFFNKYIPFFSKYIYSLLLDSVVTFAISFTLFTIFKIDYSLIGATIITITNLIPYIGPILALIPLGIIGYSVSKSVALISLAIVLSVQLVESNIIQPLIFKNVIKLHPLEGILGVLIFSYFFGAIGMILSPLLTIAFKILFIDKYEKSTSNTLEV